MKIRFKPTQKKGKTKKSKFLFLPVIFKGELYWLERVIIKKSFNGRKHQITSLIRTKDLIRKEINQSSPKFKVLKKAV